MLLSAKPCILVTERGICGFFGKTVLLIDILKLYKKGFYADFTKHAQRIYKCAL